jgi:hypothetical protein
MKTGSSILMFAALPLLIALISVGCTYVAILEAPGFAKIPLRAAVIVSNEDADWRGPDTVGTGRGQFFWESTEGDQGIKGGQSGVWSRTVRPLLPFEMGKVTHKIKTPLKCYRVRPNTFHTEAGGKREPIHEEHLEIFASQLRRQTEASLRQNLPLFLAHVEIVEAVPASASAYDVAIEPQIRRWPSAGDPVERVEVEYEFTFRAPDGGVIISATSGGTAKVESRGSKRALIFSRMLTCGEEAYWELERAYVIALVSAQGDAIGRVFFRPDVLDALRSYAAARRSK